MTDTKKEPGKSGAVELNEQEAQGVAGGASKLTKEALTSKAGKAEESLSNPKKPSIVQAYPSVEYD